LERLDQDNDNSHSSPTQQNNREQTTNIEFQQVRQSSKKEKGTFRNQVKAIFMKNLALQKKQVGTNCCQVNEF